MSWASGEAQDILTVHTIESILLADMLTIQLGLSSPNWMVPMSLRESMYSHRPRSLGRCSHARHRRCHDGGCAAHAYR